MSEKHPTVKINLTHEGTGTVHLDGIDVSKAVGGLTVEAKVGDLTTVELHCAARENVEFEGEARITVTPELRAIMLAAGWEPPARERDPLGMTGEQRSAAEAIRTVLRTDRIRENYASSLAKIRTLPEDAKVWMLGVEYTAGQVREILGEDSPHPIPGCSDLEDQDPGYDPSDHDQDLS